MTEHWGAILAAVIAAGGAAGSFLIWLVKWFAEGKAKAEERTIAVLQTAAKEAADRDREYRAAIDKSAAATERLVEGMATQTRNLENVASQLVELRVARSNSGRSGQMPAARTPPRESE